MANTLFLLEKLQDSKTVSEAKLAKYILKNSQDVPNMNITNLAAKAHTSTAAVVRLCKRLSLKGYQELRLEIAKEVVSNGGKPQSHTFETTLDYNADSTNREIADNVLNVVTNAIGNLRNLIDRKAMETTVERIRNCRSILILGTGASGIVGRDFHQKLCRLGYLSVFNEDTELQTTSACTLTEKDVVFAISYSGEHRSILRSISEAKKNHAYLIALTRFEKTELTKMADTCLYVPDTESLYREGASISRICQLLVVDIIYSTLIVKDFKHSIPLLDKTWNAIDHEASH